MDYILHIDTSGDTGSVFLTADGKVVSSIANTDSRNHSAVLNIHINTVLADAGVTLLDLSAIAVCGGPGSYTGLRISLSTAKGLCYVLEKPLMLHNKLALMALEQYYKHSSAYEVYTAILPARDKEFFICSYNNKQEVITEPRHILEAEIPGWIATLKGKMLVTSADIAGLEAIITHSDTSFTVFTSIDSDSWGRFSFDEYNHHGFVNLSTSEPFYLKQVYTHNSKTTN